MNERTKTEEKPRGEEQVRADMRRRVQEGVKVLDAQFSGWREVIDPDLLNLSSGAYCVVGHLFGHAGNRPHIEFLLEDGFLGLGYDRVFPLELGMDLSDEDHDSSFSIQHLYSMLTEEWLAAIRTGE